MSSFGMLPAPIAIDQEHLIRGLIFYAILVLSLTFHEYGHAWSANKLGDKTAERLGRLTLNPIPHLHPLFTVLLPLYFIFMQPNSEIFFAAAHPVPIDPQNLRHPVRDMMLTSVAGPAMNVILALFFTAVLWFNVEFRNLNTRDSSSVLFIQVTQLNLMLAAFNMLPIPPLDGHRVLGFFLPERLRNAYYSAGQFGFVLLLVLMARGALNPIMLKIYDAVDVVWCNLMPGHMPIFGYGP